MIKKTESYLLRVNQFAGWLLKNHSIGYLRDEADFHTAQEHALSSLFLVKLFLEDKTVKSDENRLEMIKDIEEDLLKFTPRKKP